MAKKKLSTHERREQLKKLIEAIGWWNINITKLAKEWRVDRNTLYKDVRELMKGVPKEELEEIQFNLGKAYKKAISETWIILGSADTPPEIKLKAAMNMASISEKFTGFLEAFGIKEKVAERIEYEDPATKLYEKLLKKEDKREKPKKNIQG